MQKSPLKVIFAGTPAFAATALAGIAQHPDCEVIAVYTQPDRPAKRGKKVQQSDVKKMALVLGIPVFQPENFKSEESLEALQPLHADVMVVAAYGLLLPQAVLDTPRYGCLNIHASILPRWRGAAPIERAIEAGDEQTGVTIMQMDAGLDTGDMLLVKTLPIAAGDTGDSLREKLAKLGLEAINQCLGDLYRQGSLEGEKQDDSQASYAKKLQKPEAEIDWSAPAAQIERRIRAFNSHNCCFTTIKGERLRIWQARLETDKQAKPAGTILQANKKGIVVACGEQALALEKLQLPGGKVLECHAMLNGKADWFEPGTVLGETS